MLNRFLYVFFLGGDRFLYAFYVRLFIVFICCYSLGAVFYTCFSARLDRFLFVFYAFFIRNFSPRRDHFICLSMLFICFHIFSTFGTVFYTFLLLHPSGTVFFIRIFLYGGNIVYTFFKINNVQSMLKKHK